MNFISMLQTMLQKFVAIFVALFSVILLSLLNLPIVLAESEVKPEVYLTVDSKRKRISLDAFQISRADIFKALSQQLPLKGWESLPSLKEPVSLSFTEMTIEQTLKKILEPVSFLLIKKNSSAGITWELRFLNQGKPIDEVPPIDANLLEELIRLRNIEEIASKDESRLEEIIFNGDENEALQIFHQAINYGNPLVQKKAHEFLEELGNSWNKP